MVVTVARNDCAAISRRRLLRQFCEPDIHRGDFRGKPESAGRLRRAAVFGTCGLSRGLGVFVGLALSEVRPRTLDHRTACTHRDNADGGTVRTDRIARDGSWLSDADAGTFTGAVGHGVS